MGNHFESFDLAGFWKKSDYADKAYVDQPISEELIQLIEEELGYKLPASYLELMQTQNGGIPVKRSYPTKEATSWAADHVAISGIFGLSWEKSNSLCGALGSQFMIDEWGYPNLGVYFANCPSAGHDMIALDYRKNGKEDEPEVVHIDQESDYKITFLARNFETFIKGLVSSESFE